MMEVWLKQFIVVRTKVLQNELSNIYINYQENCLPWLDSTQDSTDLSSKAWDNIGTSPETTFT